MAGNTTNIKSDDNSICDRAIRLFTYLKEIAQLRTKVVRDCLDYAEILWLDDIPREKGCYTIAWGSKAEDFDSIWIEIRKRKEPPSPKIPQICSEWINPSVVLDSDNEPHLSDRIPKFNDDEQIEFLYLNDNSAVKEAWNKYIESAWRSWAEEHKRWKSVQSIYGKLFSMYHQQKKLGEAYELVLGLGLLVWITPSGQRLRRHILIGQANLLFDADRGVIRVGPSADGVKLALETDMFEPSERPIAELEQALEDNLKTTSETPWDRNLIEPIIRSWVNAIDPKGFYSENLEPINEFKSTASSNFAPALILRKRTTRNLVSSFNTIISQFKQDTNIPFGIKRICEITKERHIQEDLTGSKKQSPHKTHEIYFPLPSNDEQSQIVKRLTSNQGILVQGPPGTGKSHTIANLICHLLATGQRVLVTSQTPRALKVLSKKVPEDILPLCVNVLGNDISSLQNLEFSVQNITERYNNWDPDRDKKNILKLEEQLYSAKLKRADTERKLRELREIDTYKHTIAEGNYVGTAQAIAQRLAAENSKHGWFLDHTEEKISIPFGVVTFHELLNAYRELSEAKCVQITQPLIKSKDIPSVEEFLHLMRNEREKIEALLKYEQCKSSSSYSPLSSADKYSRQELEESLKNLLYAIDGIRKRPLSWIPQAISAVLTDHEQPWQTLYETTKKSLEDVKQKFDLVNSISLLLPDDVNYQQILADAEDLLTHLNMGGKLGWWVFRNKLVKRTVYITRTVKINGRSCDNPQLLSNLVDYLYVQKALESIWSHWRTYADPVRASFALQISELNEYLEVLDIILLLIEPLEKAKNAIVNIDGLSAPKWHHAEEISNLLEDVYAVNAEVDLLLAKLSIEQFSKHVESITTKPNYHSINKEIINAINKRDSNAYRTALHNLFTVEQQLSQLAERTQLFNALKEVAPKLAESIATTASLPEWDTRIPMIDSTWHWAQTNAWLDKLHDEHKEKNLKNELSLIEKSIEKKTTDLAAVKAWQFCFERMTEEQRQHLMAWTKAVKRIGKGKGKHAERHRRDAQHHMEKARGAIPAWVMPFYRVVDTVPPNPEMFDVVIIDEASQSGPDSLLLLYLAKKCIIVGDDQQISPDAVGINQDDVNLLSARHLSDIPHADSLGVTGSLFGQGEIRFGGRIILREHFRCMPEIIRYSNDLCYPSTPLKPLRQYPPNRLEPIIVKYVSNGFREGGTRAINRSEATMIADVIKDCCDNPAYVGKSFGVISLQGEEQAFLIEKLLMDRIGTEEIDKRGLICGDAYDFQGDERDVIFLSMVAAPNERIGALVKESDKRRFNVAASRARDQLWLFHSATLNDLNPDCMRYKLLNYCLEPKSVLPDIDTTAFDSQFERDVYDQITARGYRVIPQFKVANYKIDLVVEGLKNRLAIECDGDEWHGPDNYDADMHRQRVLERCGWIFWRIRGCEYYRNPERSLEPLWKKLDVLGIKSKLHNSNHDSTSGEDSKLNDFNESRPHMEDVEDEYNDGETKTDESTSHEEKKKVSSADADENLPWISKIDTKIWYRMAHWAKSKGHFKPDERAHLFNIGKKLKQKIKLFPNQTKKARRLYEKAIKLGFNLS